MEERRKETEDNEENVEMNEKYEEKGRSRNRINEQREEA